MPMTTLGFLGLGVMGGPMARNLVKAGYPVVGFDTDARRLGNFAAGGGKPGMSVGEAAAGGAVVLLSLPTGDVVRDVVMGASGLLTVMKSGTIIVDLSTTEPKVAQDCAAAAAAKGITFLDGPVSGGEYLGTGGGKIVGDRKLQCVLTLAGGEVVYDHPYGLSQPLWQDIPKDSRYWINTEKQNW